MVKPNKPWEDVPEIWKDEGQYLNWLRSQTRRAWARHPLKHAYCQRRETISRLDAVAEHKIGETDYRLAKKFRCCEMCEKWTPVSKLEVDHIVGGEGFTTLNDFMDWYWRMLLVGFDSIRELCKPCHDNVTLSQKLHCSLEAVPYHRDRIAFGKLTAGQQHALLAKLELSSGSNEELRMAIYLEYLGDIHECTT